MVVYDEYNEEIRRLYEPEQDPCSHRLPLDQLVVYNANKRISQLNMKVMAKPDPFIDRNSLVVYIDGACRGNGTASARASYGVFFGLGSPHNTSGMLPPNIPQTSTRAEIEALRQALDVVCQITDKDLTLFHIKIATDSSFLVEAMSRWIEQWIDSNGLGSNGKKVAHFEVLKELHDKLDYMEFSDQGGREVQFWLIPREMNSKADELANLALDGL